MECSNVETILYGEGRTMGKKRPPFGGRIVGVRLFCVVCGHCNVPLLGGHLGENIRDIRGGRWLFHSGLTLFRKHIRHLYGPSEKFFSLGGSGFPIIALFVNDQ